MCVCVSWGRGGASPKRNHFYTSESTFCRNTSRTVLKRWSQHQKLKIHQSKEFNYTILSLKWLLGGQKSSKTFLGDENDLEQTQLSPSWSHFATFHLFPFREAGGCTVACKVFLTQFHLMPWRNHISMERLEQIYCVYRPATPRLRVVWGFSGFVPQKPTTRNILLEVLVENIRPCI